MLYTLLVSLSFSDYERKKGAHYCIRIDGRKDREATVSKENLYLRSKKVIALSEKMESATSHKHTHTDRQQKGSWLIFQENVIKWYRYCLFPFLSIRISSSCHHHHHRHLTSTSLSYLSIIYLFRNLFSCSASTTQRIIILVDSTIPSSGHFSGFTFFFRMWSPKMILIDFSRRGGREEESCWRIKCWWQWQCS